MLNGQFKDNCWPEVQCLGTQAQFLCLKYLHRRTTYAECGVQNTERTAGRDPVIGLNDVLQKIFVVMT
jgi:hypothetical protein